MQRFAAGRVNLSAFAVNFHRLRAESESPLIVSEAHGLPVLLMERR